MDFELSEEQKAIQKAAWNFDRGKIDAQLISMANIGQDEQPPRSLTRLLKYLGVMGILRRMKWNGFTGTQG